MAKPQSPSEISSVNDALNHFALSGVKGAHVPDYLGFLNWFGMKLEEAKRTANIPVHAISGISPANKLFSDLLHEIEESGIEVLTEGPKPRVDRFGMPRGNLSRLRAFNRAKLLLSYLQNIPDRMRETIASLQKSTREEQYGGEAKLSASQSQQRIAFFSAIAAGDAHMAFKMLGRLREESHDLGEIEYLEATASFHANRLDETIKHAASVPADSIDWQRAFMLRLEAIALQGDSVRFEEALASRGDAQIQEFFFRYLLQALIRNSPDPLVALKTASQLLRFQDLSAQIDLDAFGFFNRYSSNLATQLVEYRREIALRQLAVEQVGIAQPSGRTDEEDASLSMKQVEAAMTLDPDLLNEISSGKIEEAYESIVKRLINCGRPGLKEFIQALCVQWRIGDKEVFLENVIRSLEKIVHFKTEESGQILTWAYQEALALGHRTRASELEGRIRSNFPFISERLNELVRDSDSDGIERQLSPMGRLAFRAANIDLQQAERSENSWRDAGMVSLGFFRILELEFNARIILPMLDRVDMSNTEQEIAKLSAETTKSGKKGYDFWRKLWPSIKAAKQKRKGLDLGALEILLRKLNDAAGPDQVIKNHLRSSLLHRLSVLGDAALSSGELADLINENAREQYRNPPAHTRYVDIPTAQAAKVYVEGALRKLFTFTAASTGERVALH